MAVIGRSRATGMRQETGKRLHCRKSYWWNHLYPDGGWGIASPADPRQTSLSYQWHQVENEEGDSPKMVLAKQLMSPDIPDLVSHWH